MQAEEERQKELAEREQAMLEVALRASAKEAEEMEAQKNPSAVGV